MAQPEREGLACVVAGAPAVIGARDIRSHRVTFM